MKRIAFLTPEIDPGYGWARYAYDLGRALHGLGIEIVAVTQPGARLSAGGEWLADVRPVLPQLVPQQRGFLPRLVASLPTLRRAVSDCDRLHVIAEPYTPAAALIAGKRPLVVTAHGTYVPQTVRRPLVGSFYRWAYRRARLIAVSRYTAGQVRAALPGVPVTVIHNGVFFDHFQQPAPPPAKIGPTVLASGGVKTRKGTHLLVEALAVVRQTIPAAQLIVTGRQDEPDYLAQIQAQIERLGLRDCVHLAGKIPEADLLGWYQHADVFALPSLNVGEKFEGFGLVFLEASACGLPVIGTSGSGVEEAIIEGQTGLLVPQNDAPALAEAIIRLLTDSGQRARMGSAGREYAQTQDWSVVAGRVLDIYRGQ